MNDVCRLCLDNKHLLDVFDTPGSEDLAEKILTIANVHMEITDSITKNICLKCYNILLKVDKFRILCTTINQLLIDKYESKSNELLQTGQCENVEEWIDIESISETTSVTSTSNIFQNHELPSNNSPTLPCSSSTVNNKSHELKILKIESLATNKTSQSKGKNKKRLREQASEGTVPDSKKLKTDDSTFVCPLCKVTLPSWKMYLKHFEKHRSCPPCEINFNNIPEMTRHMKYVCPHFSKVRVLLNRLDDDIDLCKKYDITNATPSSSSNTPNNKSPVVLLSDINVTKLYRKAKSETVVQNNEKITLKIVLPSKCDENSTIRKKKSKKKKKKRDVPDTSNINDKSINIESPKKKICQYNENNREVDVQNDASKSNQDVNEIGNLNDKTDNNSNANISTTSPKIVTETILDYLQIKRINNSTMLEDSNVIAEETTISIPSDQNVNEIAEKENLTIETEKEPVQNEEDKNRSIQMEETNDKSKKNEDETINTDKQKNRSQIDKVIHDTIMKSIDSMLNNDHVVELDDDCTSNLTPKIIQTPKPPIKLKLKTDVNLTLRNLLLEKSKTSNLQHENPSDIIVVDDETFEHNTNEDNSINVIVIEDDEMDITSNNDQSNFITIEDENEVTNSAQKVLTSTTTGTVIVTPQQNTKDIEETNNENEATLPTDESQLNETTSKDDNQTIATEVDISLNSSSNDKGQGETMLTTTAIVSSDEIQVNNECEIINSNLSLATETIIEPTEGNPLVMAETSNIITSSISDIQSSTSSIDKTQSNNGMSKSDNRNNITETNFVAHVVSEISKEPHMTEVLDVDSAQNPNNIEQTNATDNNYSADNIPAATSVIVTSKSTVNDKEESSPNASVTTDKSKKPDKPMETTSIQKSLLVNAKPSTSSDASLSVNIVSDVVPVTDVIPVTLASTSTNIIQINKEKPKDDNRSSTKASTQHTKYPSVATVRPQVALINEKYMIYVPNTNKSENDTLKMIFANHITLCSKNKKDLSQLIVKNLFNKLEEDMPIDVTIGSKYTGKLIKLKKSVERTQHTKVSNKSKTKTVTYKNILNVQSAKPSGTLIPAMGSLQSTDTTVSNVTSVTTVQKSSFNRIQTMSTTGCVLLNSLAPRIETSLSIAPPIAATSAYTVQNVTPVFTTTTETRPIHCLKTYSKPVNTVAKIDPKMVKVAHIPVLSIEMLSNPLRKLIPRTIPSRPSAIKQIDTQSSTVSEESPTTSTTSSTNRSIAIVSKPLPPTIPIPKAAPVIPNTGQLIKLRVRNIWEINNTKL